MQNSRVMCSVFHVQVFCANCFRHEGLHVIAPSSQQELQTPDDVRTERVAIPLSVALSWPPLKRQRSAGRPTFQEAWERAVQQHILQFHELPDGAYLTRVAWWRPGQSVVRPLTADAISRASGHALPASRMNSRQALAMRSAAKVHVNAVMRDWFLDMCDAWQGERRWDMQQCMSEVREAVSWTARRDQPEHALSLETERSASSSTLQQEHSVARRLDAPDRAHHAGD